MEQIVTQEEILLKVMTPPESGGPQAGACSEPLSSPLTGPEGPESTLTQSVASPTTDIAIAAFATDIAACADPDTLSQQKSKDHLQQKHSSDSKDHRWTGQGSSAKYNHPGVPSTS